MVRRGNTQFKMEVDKLQFMHQCDGKKKRNDFPNELASAPPTTTNHSWWNSKNTFPPVLARKEQHTQTDNNSLADVSTLYMQWYCIWFVHYFLHESHHSCTQSCWSRISSLYPRLYRWAVGTSLSCCCSSAPIAPAINQRKHTFTTNPKAELECKNSNPPEVYWTNCTLESSVCSHAIILFVCERAKQMRPEDKAERSHSLRDNTQVIYGQGDDGV